MPIIPLLQGRAYGPEDIKVMTTAFEGALNALGLMDRGDPLNELVARKIIEIAKTGERHHAFDVGSAVEHEIEL